MIYVPISVRVTDTEKVTKYSTKNQRDGLHLMEKDSPFIIIFEGYTIYNNFHNLNIVINNHSRFMTLL